MNLLRLRLRSLRNVVVISSLAGMTTLHGSDNELLNPQSLGTAFSSARESSETVRDSTITTTINRRLRLARVNVEGTVSVSTLHGVVTLSGQTPAPAIRLITLALARDVDGVANVQDQMIVATGAQTLNQSDLMLTRTRRYLADSWITVQVKSQLLASNIQERSTLSVQTNQGVVTLKGRLPEPAAIDHAKDIATCVAGVSKVDISMLVQAQPAPPQNVH